MEDVPDPEVSERASRRTYTAKYKLEVLAEYERCDRAGKGALLRREGLFTSLVSAWREQRDKGALEAMSAISRGPKPVDPAARRAERLAAENAVCRLSWTGPGRSSACRGNCPCSWRSSRRSARTGTRASSSRDRHRCGHLAPIVGARAACAAVGRSRAGYYRAHPVAGPMHGPTPAPAPRRAQPRALSEAEVGAVLDVLHSERFVDAAPEAIYATLGT